MVSVVVVGFPMSGKTTLVAEIVGIGVPRVGFQETCSCNYVSIHINGVEWHVWDTPRITSVDDITSGWVGENALEEADAVVVCHDGSRDRCPMSLVRACGVDRSVLALTRGAAGREDLSYAIEYLKVTRMDGTLVPRADGITSLLSAVSCLLPNACTMATG